MDVEIRPGVDSSHDPEERIEEVASMLHGLLDQISSSLDRLKGEFSNE